MVSMKEKPDFVSDISLTASSTNAINSEEGWLDPVETQLHYNAEVFYNLVLKK